MAAVELLQPVHLKILDIGCGNGLAMQLIGSSQREVIGIDISETALSFAKSFGEVIRGDGSRLPLRDNCFDCIVILDVLEHVRDKQALFTEASRVLVPGGTVIVTAPLPRATNGMGDPRQPYDEPIDGLELVSIASDRLRLVYLKSIGWLPYGLGPIERALPSRLFECFPCLVRRSKEVIMALQKDISSSRQTSYNDDEHAQGAP